MDIAKDLALIDGLRTGVVPAEPDTEPDADGYRRAVLGLSPWRSTEDCYAYEAALSERLTERWGEPSRWGTTTLVERAARGERIPEPWGMLGALATELRAWEVAGHWVVLSVADQDAEDPQVHVVVTTTDPP
ncbi:hypothetical protein [Streptomyces sp. NPDC126514]|uniref:hypothetical protein n=1 Tax=Streptomyces sp. NPDC126514 TaxID=3155210 RepID=UPI003329B038